MKPSRIPVRANLLPRQRILNDKILGITREPTARIREEGFAPHTSAVLAVSINRFRATGKNHKALFSLSLPGLCSHRGCRILRNHAPHLGGCTNCGGVVTIDHSKSPATVTPTVDFTLWPTPAILLRRVLFASIPSRLRKRHSSTLPSAIQMARLCC